MTKQDTPVGGYSLYQIFSCNYSGAFTAKYHGKHKTFGSMSKS